ncbi:peptidoglycan D,D-transpeptidase FtsI family protein [Ornithinicoccus halotolerans]|uniref:peptidoglycan D,D-transpeptidase FtsI family protein n=1 Tax=Ornithinicoccus halotolerans TaxID=1748220 RepID=UPI001885D46C|nr:penicillin-binding protein 2 [Ornithinicoccus halotolerans]
MADAGHRRGERSRGPSRSRRAPRATPPRDPRLRDRRGVVHPQRRVRVLLLGVFVVFSLFAAQLVRLQGLDAATVSAAAIDGRLREATIPAARGTITDHDGTPLAESVERRHITADPLAVQEYTKVVDGDRVTVGAAGAAADVAEVTGSDPAVLEQRLTADPSSRFTYLVKDVSPKQWQDVRRLGIPGLHAEEYRKRTYPLGESHAPVLGWVGSGDEPAGGVELVVDDVLTGTPGRRVYEQGGAGQEITTGFSEEEPAVPGHDVTLTLDSDLQWYAYDAVKQRVEEAGAVSGYAIVTNIEGEVLALASYPSFDPSDSSQDASDMRNAAIEDAYEPGSTGKVMTAAALLEQGLVEPETPIVLPSGRLPRGGTTFKDAHDPEDDIYRTFAGVLATSSNMGTILAGEDIEDQVLYDYMRRFGMGETSGLGLPGESPGLIWAPQNWSRTTKYTMLFGQGLTSNALQQHGVFQTIANGGVSVPPTLIEGTTAPDGTVTPRERATGERVIAEETAQTLTTIMENVPSASGTAPLAAVDGYRVAGKTSTASRVDPRTGRYSGVTSAFVGYAPAEDPQYVVSVTIQRPTRISQWGGTIAGPVFSDIMRYTLQEHGVPPSDTESPEIPLVYDPDRRAPGHPKGVTLGDIAIKDERDGE